MIALLGIAFAVSPCEGGLEIQGQRFPAGDRAFANQVLSFSPGVGVSDKYGQAASALGRPDWVAGSGAVSLGVATKEVPAELILGFAVPIVDGDGPDLYVFEIGPSAERTRLAVSNDGERWFDIGVIEGQTRAVDLAGTRAEGRSWSYLRLRGVDAGSGAPWAGPDIDAVGILGCAPRPNS